MNNLYCKSCETYTAMEYDAHTRNFICQTCDKLLLGRYGYEILEYDDAGDMDLYMTENIANKLKQGGVFKKLKKFYNNRIWISTEQ